METTRNDPCPCGSGEKYKNCCLDYPDAKAVPLVWHRLRTQLPALTSTLFQFVLDNYGWCGAFEAWDELQGFQDVELDLEGPEAKLFQAWLLFDWTPVPNDTHVPMSLPTDLPPASLYLERHRAALDPLAARYLEAAGQRAFSFFEVLSVVPGEGFTARDLLMLDELAVAEKQGSRHLRAGELTFAKPVVLDELTTFAAMAHFPIPATGKDRVLELGRRLSRRRPLSQADLSYHATELLELYRAFRDEALRPGGSPVLPTDRGGPVH